MKEVTVKLYKFNELSEKVQETLIQDNREHETEHDDWFEPITEGFEEDMKNAGFDDITIGFTGFWSQGDGACFYGKVTDNQKLIETLKEEDYIEKELNIPAIDDLNIHIIKTSRHYEHENTIAGNVEGDWANDHDLLENAVTKWARDKSRELYKSLEKYHDELTSDEYVIEYLEEQGEVFQENGKRL
jgi:hypothetical protein